MALWLLLIAPAMGSFAALLADRLPRGESVIIAPSRCRSCATRLGWFELLPLISYLMCRGRCRHCQAPLPMTLLLAELAALALAWAMVWRGGSVDLMLLGCGWLWCLLALALSDLQWFRLPNILTGLLFGLGLGLGWQTENAANGPGGLAEAGLTAALGAGALLALRLGYRGLRGREGMGLGDVKLMAGIGAGLGALGRGTDLPLVLLFAALAALIWAGVLHWSRGIKLHGTLALPFGTFLCAAAALVWLADIPPG